ncbi:hypothetical protein [Streptomyces sp. H51]|uniref:hypothetical protein n=1 Tax=Streptomyces sp. H51 TaxID=3111770 RepID=UPI002D78CE00|nr:hypothetical protein [Streptomyces sp. H51]
MGAIECSVPVTGNGDMNAARADLWKCIYGFVRKHVGASTEEVFYYLDGNDPCDTDDSDDCISWKFRDLAGCCTRSMNVWLHWLVIAFAANWDTFDSVARRHGFTFTGERPVLADLLADMPDRFVVLRGDVWQVYENGLWGDDRVLSLDDLSPEEWDRYEAAKTLCRCDLCVELRPVDQG